MIICGIKYTPLEKEREKEISSILFDGHKELQRLREEWQKENNEEISFNAFYRAYLKGEIGENKLIAAVKAVQVEMIAGHVGVLIAIVRRFGSVVGGERDRLLDLESEAVVGTIHATYCYNDKSIKFNTFLYLVVSRYLEEYLRKYKNGLSPINPDYIELSRKVWDYIASKPSERITFDEACIRLGIDYEKAKEILAVGATCLNHSDIAVKRSDDEIDDDYPHSLEPSVVDLPIIDPDLLKAVDTAPLSDVERAAFLASIEDHHGWRTEVAAQFKNPKTDKPYTSAAIAIILPRAQQKIRQRYDEILSERKVA